MSAKHTPGPWTQGTSAIGIACVWLDGLTEQEYTMGQSHTWIDCETEANARLISAAPDLLEFVKEWLDRQGSDENYMTAKARDIITKAGAAA